MRSQSEQSPARDSQRKLADAIVVGAGLAGLTAADLLRTRGLDVRALEARSRVGGRTFSRQLAGQAVDLGAEHIGAGHRGMLALAKRLGIEVADSGLYRAKTRWQVGGRDKTGNLPPGSVRDLARTAHLMSGLARRARRLPVDEPWRAPSARELDQISLAEWLDQARISGPIREAHDALWEDGFTVETERISLLQVAWTIRRAGGLINSIRDTILYEVKGGTQTIAEALAATLHPNLLLDHPVTRIDQDGETVAVTTADGSVHEARQLVLAVPVPTVNAIEFSPQLPDEIDEAHTQIGFGRATTIIVGSASAAKAPFGFVIGSPTYGAAWRRGPTAKTKPPDIPKTRVPEVAREVAEGAAIPNFDLEIASQDWTDEPYTRGSYVNFKPGQLTRFGPHLRRSHGRVHFAAAERSSWPTFMEGALESGRRAATAVMAELTGAA